MEQTISSMHVTALRREIEYPESDGKPMGETSFHIMAMMYLLSALRYYFRDAADVNVASDMLMYLEEGDPSQFVVPDVFVVKGVPKYDRRTFKIWEERAVPAVIFEVTSKGTRIQDLAQKRGLYEMLGVREYFLFDPLDEYLKPRYRGFRQSEKGYDEIELDENGGMFSVELQALLQPDGKLLRVLDPKTGEFVPTFDEWAGKLEAETERAEAEAERAQAQADRAARAEAEVARLNAEMERLRQAKKD